MSETLEETVEDEVVAHVWEVWRDHPAGLGDVNTRILEYRGDVVSESEYRPIGYGNESSALAEIVRVGGGHGSYVLMHGERVMRFEIVAETVYHRIDGAA